MSLSMPSASRSAGFCLSLDETSPKILTLCPPLPWGAVSKLPSWWLSWNTHLQGAQEILGQYLSGCKCSAPELRVTSKRLMMDEQASALSCKTFTRRLPPTFLTDLWSQYSSFFIMWGLFYSWARCNKELSKWSVTLQVRAAFWNCSLESLTSLGAVKSEC